jgi:hypothetical protein
MIQILVGFNIYLHTPHPWGGVGHTNPIHGVDFDPILTALPKLHYQSWNNQETIRIMTYMTSINLFTLNLSINLFTLNLKNSITNLQFSMKKRLYPINYQWLAQHFSNFQCCSYRKSCSDKMVSFWINVTNMAILLLRQQYYNYSQIWNQTELLSERHSKSI